MDGLAFLAFHSDHAQHKGGGKREATAGIIKRKFSYFLQCLKIYFHLINTEVCIFTVVFLIEWKILYRKMLKYFTMAWFKPAHFFFRALKVPHGPAVSSALDAAVQLYLQ